MYGYVMLFVFVTDTRVIYTCVFHRYIKATTNRPVRYVEFSNIPSLSTIIYFHGCYSTSNAMRTKLMMKRVGNLLEMGNIHNKHILASTTDICTEKQHIDVAL